MSILDILKKIKFPVFGDDFIQDPTEKGIAEFQTLGEIKEEFDPCKASENFSARKDLHAWLDEEWERHFDPSDGVSMSNIDSWEE